MIYNIIGIYNYIIRILVLAPRKSEVLEVGGGRIMGRGRIVGRGKEHVEF
jgi:hypothetical protein